MDRRFAARREQLLADAEVDRRILHGVLPRLERFLDPFVALLQRREHDAHARHYVAGLLANLKYKNVESIAYLHDQRREPLQQFIGQVPWDHQPWLTELARQVGQKLGSPDGVLVFDPSAFAKKGQASVGVQRQWCGRLGKIDNCQVGIYLAYVGASDHALVDVRLYLPREWTRDRKRCQAAGVPRTVRFRTRHELALEMLDERGPLLPHAWVSGDDELGRCSRFRQELRERGERYLLAVPSNTSVRDLTAPTPPVTSRSRHRPARRNRGHNSRAAGQTAAGTRKPSSAGGRSPIAESLCPGDRRHEYAPAAGRRRRTIPPGLVLPPERDLSFRCRRCARGAPTSRC